MKRLSLFSAFIALFTAGAWVLSGGSSFAQDWAKDRIDKSPRHLEWVKVKHDDREVNCQIAYPEVKDNVPAVIVIHEIFGLSDWARSMTDELAEAGYIAIAPDLLWGKGPGGEGTEAISKSGGNIGQSIQSLPPDQITADLNAVADYVTKVPSCNGKLVVCGFCWGGTQSFRYATNNKNLKAAFVFYGQAPMVRGSQSQPDENALARIVCPVYGFYAGNDNRIDSTIPATTDAMKKLNKSYEPVIYEGAGHGFMRAGEQPDAQAANKKARDEAWTRWKDLLKKM